MKLNPKELRVGAIVEFKLILGEETYIGKIVHKITRWPLDEKLTLYDIAPTLAYHHRFCWQLTDKVGLGEIYSTGSINMVHIIEPAP